MKHISRYQAGLLLLFIAFLHNACGDEQRFSMQYGKGEVYPPDQLYAVIEMPAGNSVVQRFDFIEDRLKPTGDTLNFLPFPGNFGFMLRREAFEQDLSREDHISCLVLSSTLNPREILAVYPVGVLMTENQGKREDYVICVPESGDLQTLPIKDFVDFMTEYEAVRFQIQHWFANFQGANAVHILGWEDEHYASRLIENRGKQ